jgi:hypothetical protein
MEDSYFTALSSILTVVAVLFGLWYSDIQNIRELPVSERLEDNKPAEKKITQCLRVKVVPLFIISLLTGLLFACPALGILIESVTYIISGSAVYDPSRAAFVFLVVLMFFLAFLLGKDIWCLRRLYDKAIGKSAKVGNARVTDTRFVQSE